LFHWHQDAHLPEISRFVGSDVGALVRSLLVVGSKVGALVSGSESAQLKQTPQARHVHFCVQGRPLLLHHPGQGSTAQKQN